METAPVTDRFRAADDGASLSRRARQLYGDASGFAVALQKLRPFICPFGRLIEQVPPGSMVLDVGCGAGLFLGLLAADHRIVRGVGFDSSTTAIALANRMRANVPREVSLEFVVANAIDSWPAEEHFDVVSLVDVMHHIPRALQSRVLSYAIDRVRPGGLLLYKDMALHPRWRAWCNQAHDLLLARQWIHHVPIGQVERQAAAAGLHVAARGSATRLWYAHEWRVFQRSAS